MLFHCPKLTPLQSRFAASFGALFLLVLVYWSISSPHFAYAAELEVDGSGQSRVGEDHNWHRIERALLLDDGVEDEKDVQVVVERRQTDVTAISENNAPNNLNILPGNTTLWVYSAALLNSAAAPATPGLPSPLDYDNVNEAVEHAELRRRQQARKIYVSINTCLQPSWNGTGTQTAAPPQLTLYVATGPGNRDLGPNGNSQIVQPLSWGFANVSVPAFTTESWYIAVSAPALPEGFEGSWNYELAVSHDAFYHSVDQNDPFFYLIDTDNAAALLVTGNLTHASPGSTVYKQWMDWSTPFIMFGANVNDMAMMGLNSSYCGWKNSHQIAASQLDAEGTNSHVQTGMITRGLGNNPRQQFYVTDLNSSSSYFGVLAQPGNSTAEGAGVVGGGGKIWQTVPWQTKSDGNCALMFNMSFCDEVAYAVPSNPKTYSNISALRQVYDNYTSFYYQAFNYSLQQIPCNTTSGAQYSTVRNCDDCAAAYKQWLCAVSIPRCDDFSNNQTWLQPRAMAQPFANGSMLPDNILYAPYVPMDRAPTLEGSPAYKQTYLSAVATNSSRNPTVIDDIIQPGPYRELLPCEDLCYSLVQSCSSALGFVCPYPGRGLEAGYGRRNGNGNGTLTCSYLGAVFETNGASGLFNPVFRALMVAALMALIVGVA